MKSTKKVIALLLAAALSLALLAGCGAKQNVPTAAPDESASVDAAKPDASPATESKDAVTIVDHAGNEVELPATINRVVIDEVPLYATYVMYWGGRADKLVGMPDYHKKSLEKSLITKIAPEISDVSIKYNEDGELNVEELMNLKPDIVLYNAGSTEHCELFKKAGIPAVGFNTSGDPTKIYAEWLRLLEDVFQEPGKMDDVIAYGDKLIADIESRTSAIPEDQRKSALLFLDYNNGTPMVSGAERHFGHYWLANAGVNNAASEVIGVTDANMEQVYSWDPDLIIMPGPGMCAITPKQMIENTVEGADFSPLTAVKNEQVYSSSLGMLTWFIPSSDAPLILQWIAQLAYPDTFADVDLRKMVKDYYKNYYKYDLSEEDLDFIFRRSEDK